MIDVDWHIITECRRAKLLLIVGETEENEPTMVTAKPD